MAAKGLPLLKLAETTDGQEADWFLLLSRKEELKTREGKPYFRVTLRDATREITVPIWHDSAWADACRHEWQTGVFYKVRGIYKDSQFGAQIEIRKIRETTADDLADGFDPLALLPRTKYDVAAMYAELTQIARERIEAPPLSALVLEILTHYRETICDLPAAVHHHHAFRGGFLEHVLSVARNAVFLADKYALAYPEYLPPKSRDLVVVGAILHDIGKMIELKTTPSGAEYTAAGELIGHAVLGRDLVREFAQRQELDPEIVLRLEHIVLSHQRTPEWGAPKPPMTLESLLVFYADDIDARLQMMVEALQNDTGSGCVTSPRNALQQKVFRG